MRIDRCCCCDLATGTLILLICEIIAVIVSFIMMSEKEPEDDLDYGSVIYDFIRLGAAISGLWGVCQKRPKYLKPFLYTIIMTTLSTAIDGILWPEEVIMTQSDHDIPYPALLILISIGIALSVYFIIVIRSYMWQLKEEEEAEKNANQYTTFIA